MEDKKTLLVQHNLLNKYGETIRVDVRYNDDGSKKPIIIICHSYMAFKNWGFFPYLASSIAEAGYVSVIFNFSRNGVAGDGVRITEFDRFASNTFSRELEDLQCIVEACRNSTLTGDIGDPERIGLVGHSRGGGIAIAYAASDKRVTVLVTLAAIATFDRWREHQKQEWRTKGFLSLARDTNASPLRMGVEVLDDLEQNASKLNILKAAAMVDCPWLIVHGKADVTVPCKEAEALYRASNKTETKISIIEHTGHLFNAASQGEDGYRTLHHVLETAIQFFHQSL